MKVQSLLFGILVLGFDYATGFIPVARIAVNRDSKDNTRTANTCVNQTNHTTQPYPGECSLFYACIDGEAIPDACPNGYWYDPIMKACVFDFNGRCSNACPNITGTVNLPTPNCQRYFNCMNGRATPRNCTLGGFNVKTGECTLKPVCAETLCAIEADYVSYPVVGEASLFFKCSDGELLLHRCDDNLYYNSSLKVCLARAASKMFSPIMESYSVGVPLLDGGNSHRLNSSLAELPHNTSKPISGCDPTWCAYSRGDRSIGMNPQDRHSFCLCMNKQLAVVKCPFNAIFNPNSLLCELETKQGECNDLNCKRNRMRRTFAAENTNAGFCRCVSVGLAEYSECSQGTTFDPITELCAITEKAVSGNCNVDMCRNDAQRVFPTSTNEPRGFCVCQNEDRVLEQRCADDTLFDTRLMMCQPPASDENSLLTSCDIAACAAAVTGRSYAIPSVHTSERFCYCLAWNRMIELSCPASKTFNVRLGICIEESEQAILTSTSPSASTNDVRSACANGYKHGALMAHPLDCRRFLICANGRFQTIDCGVGNFYDEVSGICKWDKQGQCAANAIDAGCESRYNEGDLVADMQNEHRYYVCYNGMMQLQNCGVTRFFDVTEQSCRLNRSRHISRKVRSVPTVTSAERSSVQLSVENKDTVAKANMVEKDPACVDSAQRSVPSNCSQYEICLDGGWWRRTCTRQRYYNPEQRLCLEPRDDRVCAYAHVTGLPNCRPATEGLVLPAKDANCGNYFRCVGGLWALKPCPHEQYFSSRLGTCIPMTTAAGGDCLPTEKEKDAKPIVAYAESCQHTAVRSRSADCRMYYMCLEGEWWHQHCPLGTYFNQTLNACLSADDMAPGPCQDHVKAPLNSITNCTVSGETRVFPLNCTAYEVCGASDGQWHRRNCPPHFAFDDVQRKCVAAQKYNSCAANGLRRMCRNGETRPMLNSSALVYCEANEWRVGACLEDHRYDTELGACLPFQAVNVDGSLRPQDVKNHNTTTLTAESLLAACRNRTNGQRLPHPGGDCSRYIACAVVNNTVTATERRCATNLYFNPTRSACLPADGTCPFPSVLPANATIGPVVAGGGADTCAGQHGLLLPDSHNCNDFYVCLNGRARHETCYDGYHFNATAGQCVASGGNSPVDIIASDTPSNHQPVCKDARRNFTELCALLPSSSSVAVADDCRRYINCPGMAGNSSADLAVEQVQQRCRNGENFDSVLNMCRQTDGTCMLENGQRIGECVNRHGQRVVNTRNCRGFYACLNAQKIAMLCGEEELFDKTELRCVPDVLRQCQGEVVDLRIGVMPNKREEYDCDSRANCSNNYNTSSIAARGDSNGQPIRLLVIEDDDSSEKGST